MNPMEQVRINKATVNIGVGQGGEELVRAEKALNKHHRPETCTYLFQGHKP